MTERRWKDVTEEEKDRMRLWRDVDSSVQEVALHFNLSEDVVAEFFTGRIE